MREFSGAAVVNTLGQVAVTQLRVEQDAATKADERELLILVASHEGTHRDAEPLSFGSNVVVVLLTHLEFFRAADGQAIAWLPLAS